jgi:hypothetical protein
MLRSKEDTALLHLEDDNRYKRIEMSWSDCNGSTFPPMVRPGNVHIYVRMTNGAIYY